MLSPFLQRPFLASGEGSNRSADSNNGGGSSNEVGIVVSSDPALNDQGMGEGRLSISATIDNLDLYSS